MLRYSIIRQIGKGSFGTVDLVKRNNDGKQFVLKRMKIGSVSSKEREMGHNEVGLLERLNHPSIVRYEESFIDNKRCETYLCVVMAYCDGGDLTHFLKNQRGKKLREKHVLDLFVQIALALHFVHNRNILHRDLKAQNIFVKNGQLKLGDFGISKVLTGSVAFAQTMIGTPYYMSPEVFKGKPYNFKSDIWSLGCVLYELITFKHCFDASNLNSLAQKIVRGRYLPISSHNYRNELKLLCYSMLNQLPSQRPTLTAILKHKLLTNRIRDFYISCYRKFKQNVISQSTFNNLKNQLFEIGLSHICQDNIEDIAQQQTLKKAAQRRLKEEQLKIEKEKKIQQNMEAALEKLKLERKWRAAQKKQRRNYSNNNYGNPNGRKRHRIRSLADNVGIADKRRRAAKQRKLQLLKQQEAKRQELAARNLNRQRNAAKRKNMELNRKNPYSQIKSEKRNKVKKINKSPKKKKEEDQVGDLDMWEDEHFDKNRNQKPRRNIVKQQNFVFAPEKESKFQNKKAIPFKKLSPRPSIVSSKKNYQKEYDALEGLRKRRELIQKKLNEISQRHRERQLKKQNRKNMNKPYYSHHLNQMKKERNTKSEQPFISNSKAKAKNTINTKAVSQKSSPYKKPPQLRGNRIPFTSPNSNSPSPLKYAGINVIKAASNPGSNVQSISVSPSPNPEEIGMNPRERMAARKRAKADQRANELKNASKKVFHQNKHIAKLNKYKNVSQRMPQMQRAESLDVFAENEDDDDESSQAMSEPALKGLGMTIDTIQEMTEIEEEDEEEDMLKEEEEKEIEDLKQTLMEHTMQIEEIKNTILMKQKEQLSESDNDLDDNDDPENDDDVETLLNKQIETMKTMRLEEARKSQESIAIKLYNAESVVYQQIDSPNNIDITYNQRIVRDSIIEPEEEESDESSEEMPIGRLVDRIEFIKRKCIDGMNMDGFRTAYNLMKRLQYKDKQEFVSAVDAKIKQLCNKNGKQISKSRVKKYKSLIDQLLFIEANCS